MRKTLTMPSSYSATNKKYVIGIDEVGVGCIAGPTYVCAVKAPKDWKLEGVRDSKQLSEKKRNTFSEALLTQSTAGTIVHALAFATPFEIDREGILNAIHRLYYLVLNMVGMEDSEVFVDGKRFKESRYEYTALVGGDDIVPHISAASVIAKVARDRYMTVMHDSFPVYNWKKNKGYPSPEHKVALEVNGYCNLHRKSFEPVKSMVSNVSSL